MKGKPNLPSHLQSRASHLLGLVHTDGMGPMRTKLKGGAKYALTFGDDYSKYVIVL